SSSSRRTRTRSCKGRILIAFFLPSIKVGSEIQPVSQRRCLVSLWHSAPPSVSTLYERVLILVTTPPESMPVDDLVLAPEMRGKGKEFKGLAGFFYDAMAPGDTAVRIVSNRAATDPASPPATGDCHRRPERCGHGRVSCRCR